MDLSPFCRLKGVNNMIARKRVIRFITNAVVDFLDSPEDFFELTSTAREAVEKELTEEENEIITAMSVSIYRAIKGR